MPRETVKDFKRNNTLLFSAGSFGWVAEEESGFCLSAQEEVTTWEEITVLRRRAPVLGVAQCLSHILALGAGVF